jgi:hypothetical protein
MNLLESRRPVPFQLRCSFRPPAPSRGFLRPTPRANGSTFAGPSRGAAGGGGRGEGRRDRITLSREIARACRSLSRRAWRVLRGGNGGPRSALAIRTEARRHGGFHIRGSDAVCFFLSPPLARLIARTDAAASTNVSEPSLYATAYTVGRSKTARTGGGAGGRGRRGRSGGGGGGGERSLVGHARQLPIR